MIHDGLDQVSQTMSESDAWMLGTPIHVHAPTAQCKAFIDRCYDAGSVPLEGKSVSAIVPFADSDARAGKLSMGFLEDVLQWKRLDHVSTMLAPGVWAPGALRDRERRLKLARDTGRELLAQPS